MNVPKVSVFIALYYFLGCSSEPVDELVPKLSSIQEKILGPSCATAFCHSSTVHAGNLVLEAGESHAQMVGVFSENAAARSEGLKRVVPGDPDASFLFIKVQKVTNSNYGQTMPTQMPDGLPADQLAVIRAWIANGAKDD